MKNRQRSISRSYEFREIKIPRYTHKGGEVRIGIVLLLLSVMVLAFLVSSCLTVLKDFDLTVITNTGTGTGTVTSIPKGIDCGNDCTASFKEKTKVTLTAKANKDSSFKGWSEGCINIATTAVADKTCTVLMDKAKTVTATFTKNLVNLAVEVTGNGKVSSSPTGINDCTDNCNADFAENSTVTLTATPDAGWSFTSWSANCTTVTPTTCTTTMDAAKTVTATFTQILHTLTVTKTGNGSVSSDPSGISCGTDCKEKYTAGTRVTLTATPDSGWTFKGWSSNCTKVTATTCTTTMDAAKTVVAKFESWPKLVGTSSDDYANALATDSTGNVYMAGSTEGKLFGDSTHKGLSDAYILKYNAAGKELWHKQLGTSGDDYAFALATDSSGNVYLAGTTGGKLFESFYKGDSDAYILKYNADGKELWHKLLGTSSFDYATALATDSSGNVYMAGFTGGDLFGDSTHKGGNDAFIIKYNADGSELWHKLLGTSSTDEAYALATDSSGNVYMAGSTNGKLFEDSTYNGGNDAFIVKYNADGSEQWQKIVGTSHFDLATALATDSSGNVYMAGDTGGNLFGKINKGDGDAYIVEYNADGKKLWHKLLGTSSEDYANSLATDGSGNVYLAGHTYGDLFRDSNNIPADAYIVKYNADGTELWNKQLGTSTFDRAKALATDSAGNVYMAGHTDGKLFGKTNHGHADAFIAKY